MALLSVPPLGVRWVCFLSHSLAFNIFIFGPALWRSMILFSVTFFSVQWFCFLTNPLACSGFVFGSALGPSVALHSVPALVCNGFASGPTRWRSVDKNCIRVGRVRDPRVDIHQFRIINEKGACTGGNSQLVDRN